MRASQLDPELEAHLCASGLTYDQVGRTSGVLPNGYHHLHREVNIGVGMTRFTDAAGALLNWQMHLRSGFRVWTSSATVKRDAVVMLGLGAGPLRLNAPCRVVYVIDEPNRVGFAYGTLPGHPETGEEAFVIEREADDAVMFRITAFSKPASSLAKLAGPLGRVAQQWMTTRYLRSLTDTSERHA